MAQEYILKEVNRKVKTQLAPGLKIVELVPAQDVYKRQPVDRSHPFGRYLSDYPVKGIADYEDAHGNQAHQG